MHRGSKKEEGGRRERKREGKKEKKQAEEWRKESMDEKRNTREGGKKIRKGKGMRVWRNSSPPNSWWSLRRHKYRI